MKEYVDVIANSFFILLGIFATVLVIQAFRKKPNKVGPALKDTVNKFS